MPRDQLVRYDQTVLVQVEIEFSAVPPPEEMENVRRARMMLARDVESISVRRGETGRRKPAIVLDFEMKTQLQHRVVDYISHTVQTCIAGKFYSDMVMRFPKRPEAKTGDPQETRGERPLH